MAVSWKKDKETFMKTYGILQRVLLSISIPILFTLIVWSEQLLLLVYGADFTSGAAALRLVLLGVYFAFQSMLMVQCLSTSMHERKVAATLMIAVLVNIALNSILIPRNGFFGAAVATMITECLYYLALWSIASITGTVKRSSMDIIGIAGGLLMAFAVVEGDRLMMPWLTIILFLGWGAVMWRVRLDRLVLSHSV